MGAMPYLKPAPWFLIGFLILIFIVHGWALASSAYFYIWWLDSILHFSGGFWLAALAIFILISREKIYSFEHPLFLFLIIISLVALMGVLWEFFEYGLDLILERVGTEAALQPGAKDTIFDLFFDLTGGILAQLIFRKRARRV